MTQRTAIAFAILLLFTGEASAAGHALECPARALAEWGGSPGLLNAVQVVSAKRGETIDDAAPPDLVPDAQHTSSGILHSQWRMNSDGPDWLFYVWCHYAGTSRVLKLAAPGVTRCEYTTSAAHTDRPPQQMVCD
jgi:hypothetical protein